LPQDRIELYRALVNRFPNDSVTVQAEFMIGFTYAEDVGDTDQAREEFEKFIARHPNHELATSAKWMMENMDKPAPDLEGGDTGDTGKRGAATDSTRTVPPKRTQGSP
jgi:outer membrane protein assembly factor BamD (BamD/ComL family)